VPVIEMEIDEKGEIIADFKGFQGMTCKVEEKKLLRLLEKMNIKKRGEELKKEEEHEEEKRTR
jgi:hypothetical protein